MLSAAAKALPAGGGWQFEPKWDGFRTLVFRDGDEIVLQSRDERPMNRYFPEVLGPLAAALPERCVVAGFRWHKQGERPMVGSLLLGLYDGDGALHHVGVTASFTNAVRKQLVEELAPLRADALDGHPWRHWAEAYAEATARGQRLP